VSGQPWDEERRRGCEQRTRGRHELGNRSLRALGPIDPERDRTSEYEECKGELEIEIAATERRVTQKGRTFAKSKAERSANCAVAMTTYTGIAINAIAAEIPKAIESARRRVSGRRRTTGRAVAMRRTKRPIAAMMDRKTIARAVTRLGVAAVSEIEGTGNCGQVPDWGRPRK